MAKKLLVQLLQVKDFGLNPIGIAATAAPAMPTGRAALVSPE